MNVVTCYKAAQLAGVSRQYIKSLKDVNAKDKTKYRYFGYDKDSGKFGVDIDHPEWKNYISKKESTNNNKKSDINNTESKPIYYNNSDYVHKTNLINAVVNTLKSDLGLKGSELKKVLDGIERRYQK